MKKDLVLKYKEIKDTIKYYQQDIIDTEKILNDPKIDYVTKKEYQNDLILDRREIMILEEEMHNLLDFIYQNNLTNEKKQINAIIQEEKKEKVKKIVL